MGSRIDHVGQKFGRLTVIEPTALRDGAGSIKWRCLCDCGKEAVVSGRNLRSGESRSCGCLFLEVAAEKGRRLMGATHGKTGTPTYTVWVGMKQRCLNADDPKWGDYGGRGIKVCDRWRDSFTNFLADMGEKPSPQHSLDRWPDVNGDYEPSNCRWATQYQQQNNRRNNRMVMCDGALMTASEAARRHGLSPSLVHERMSRGIAGERLFLPPEIKHWSKTRAANAV